MKVIEHINQAKDTLISFEILPPLKGKGIQSLYQHLDPLMEFKPSFINVTYHRSEHVFKKTPDGTFQKVVIRKRPGTESICAAIMNKYSVDTVPHLICGGFGVNETEDALINLNYLGIDNVLVLRGDAAKNETAFLPEPGGLAKTGYRPECRNIPGRRFEKYQPDKILHWRSRLSRKTF
jgi:methylenetetrahydrofolate reductase (NADPH)